MSKHRLILLLSCFVMTLVILQYGVAQTPDSILKGEYILTQYSGTGDEADALYISVNFDGDGNGTSEIIYSSSGYMKSGSFTYSVNDDGTFSLTDPDMEDNPLHGVVSSDGESFTMWTEPGILVGIKKSSGMSDASLSGEYIMTEYYHRPEGENIAEYISVNFDGDGTGTFEIIYSSGGEEGWTVPFTYSVNDDGTFSFTVTENGGGGTIQGIVSSDGEIFTMAYSQSEFGIYAGIAKSD